MMADVDTSFRPEVDINLGVGYVNEDTIPRHLWSQSLDKVLANPQSYPLALNYGGPNGTPYLIESIRRFYHQQHLCETNLDVLAGKQILIGASGATSLLDAIASTIKTGIVLTADPIYYIFADLLERLGFDVIAVPEDQHGIRTEHLQKTIESLGDKKKRIRFMYIVTVNNPTCSILSNQRRQDLVQIASNLSNQLGRKVPLGCLWAPRALEISHSACHFLSLSVDMRHVWFWKALRRQTAPVSYCAATRLPCVTCGSGKPWGA